MPLSSLAKPSSPEQAAIIREHAIYLDEYTNEGKTVHVFYINGFFIEAISNVGIIIDVMPYLRGRNHDDIRSQRMEGSTGSSVKPLA